jgi:tetratricopeptide (TPR) repeat protein
LEEKLAADFPVVPGYRMHLGYAQINLGQLVYAQGRPTEALSLYEKGLAHLEAIQHQEPQAAYARYFMFIGRRSRAKALDNLERPEEALADWDRAVELATPADRHSTQMRRARCRARAGRAAEAVADAAALTKEPGTPGPMLYDAACTCSLAGQERGPKTPSAELREQYAAQAVALLRRAQAAGFFKEPRRVEHLKKDPDLARLRAHEDYRKFVAELEAAAAKK